MGRPQPRPAGVQPRLGVRRHRHPRQRQRLLPHRQGLRHRGAEEHQHRHLPRRGGGGAGGGHRAGEAGRDGVRRVRERDVGDLRCRRGGDHRGRGGGDAAGCGVAAVEQLGLHGAGLCGGWGCGGERGLPAFPAGDRHALHPRLGFQRVRRPALRHPPRHHRRRLRAGARRGEQPGGDQLPGPVLDHPGRVRPRGHLRHGHRPAGARDPHRRRPRVRGRGPRPLRRAGSDGCVAGPLPSHRPGRERPGGGPGDPGAAGPLLRRAAVHRRPRAGPRLPDPPAADLQDQGRGAAPGHPRDRRRDGHGHPRHGRGRHNQRGPGPEPGGRLRGRRRRGLPGRGFHRADYAVPGGGRGAVLRAPGRDERAGLHAVHGQGADAPGPALPDRVGVVRRGGGLRAVQG
mmetsp:Transcript_97657/g.260671  ORF Transcript_97657/g.260671 Transcript_97657/m.260671 type:complete len:400 (-) Transcript_97657:1438-2637(-)